MTRENPVYQTGFTARNTAYKMAQGCLCIVQLSPLQLARDLIFRSFFHQTLKTRIFQKNIRNISILKIFENSI